LSSFPIKKTAGPIKKTAGPIKKTAGPIKKTAGPIKKTAGKLCNLPAVFLLYKHSLVLFYGHSVFTK
jgi:uncharacterized protein YjbJ (UPF0337 family)